MSRRTPEEELALRREEWRVQEAHAAKPTTSERERRVIREEITRARAMHEKP